MSSPQQSNKAKKKQLLYRLLAFCAFLILVNFAAQKWFVQWDLTKDKRYTVTPATKALLSNMKGRTEITVFLKGDYLPAAFKNLSESTESLLKNFRSSSNGKVTYKFVDPINSESSVIETMGKFGMTGIPVTINGKVGSEQKMIFPWALITYHPQNGAPERQSPVFLQESNSMVLSKTVLNRSEVLLEYNLANAINQLAAGNRAFIAYLTGNGEAFGPEIASTFMTIGKSFDIDTLNLSATTAIDAQKYKAIIVNKPMVPFSDVDLFKIDQYIMAGGKALFAIDAVAASIDSFSQKETFMAMPTDLRLNELLFAYGVRINGDLVLDAANNAGIPVTANGTAQPKIFSWPYFPILQGNEASLISKNLEGVLARFASSLTLTQDQPNIKKTPLLTSSAYAKTEGAPAVIMYKSVLDEPNPATFTKKSVPVAALLEGKFVSAFTGHMPESVRGFVQQQQLLPQLGSNGKSKIIVVGDADIFINEVSEVKGHPEPKELGVYRFNSGFRFDNRSFLQNCLEYLINDQNLLAARNKTFENRILDPKRVDAERARWQILSIGLPVALVLLFAAIYLFLRKRRYDLK